MKGYSFNCVLCGKEFIQAKDGHKYCSNICKCRYGRYKRGILPRNDYLKQVRDKADAKIMSGIKKCSKCKDEKLFNEFHKVIRGSKSYDGYRTCCKKCWNDSRRVYDRKVYERRKVKSSDIAKICVECKKEFIGNKGKYCSKKCSRLVYGRRASERYKNDISYREKVLKEAKDRHRKHPEFLLARKHKRKSLELKLHDGTVTKDALSLIMNERKTCTYCGKELTKDNKRIEHMDPLSKGGEHSITNIVIACHSCNALKSSKSFEEWLHYIPIERVETVKKIYERKHNRAVEQLPLMVTWN